MTIILAVAAFVILLFWLADRADRSEKKNSNTIKCCDKQPDKGCPYKLKMNPDGGFSASGQFKCCKVIDKMKATNEAFCNLVPGQVYGEIIITEEFHKACLANKIRYDAMDTSGPQE